MPLNPEDVVNKRFSATKFKKGYDEEEVDEFLDEVVAELRRLNAENQDLRSKLSACEGRVSELSKSGSRPQSATAPVAGAAGPSVTGAATAPANASAPTAVPAASTPTPPPATSAPVAPAASAAAPASIASAPVAAAAPGTDAGTDSVAGMLALAQRLHDEHVAAGRSKSAKLLADAQEQAARMVREAEERRQQTLGALQTQRQSLESAVEDLRAFEREYRSRLKAYLEGQLRDLQARASAAPPAPVGAAVGGGPLGGGSLGSGGLAGGPAGANSSAGAPTLSQAPPGTLPAP